MKRLSAIIALFSVCLSAQSQTLEFNYSASADVVSCYIWRGLYNGGLSFQPSVSLGWSNDHISFGLGAWGNVGASDWGFRKGLEQTEDGNPNTYFVPEFDLSLGVNLWGVTLGISQYYFFDGKSYFNFGDINTIDGSAQTEALVGYDFSTLFPIDLQLSWNTMVSGSDGIVDGKRCFSTYIEAAYAHHFKNDISLSGVVGVSPWRSIYTDTDNDEIARNFAVNNLTLRLDKTWSLAKDAFEMSLYVQGTMNTCNLNRENAFIKASGDNKINAQKLMGAIGVNISF